MSAYDSDPRVTKIHPYHYVVDVDGAQFTVTSFPGEDGWHANPGDLGGSPRRGPFGTADDAIRSLIGDPK